MAELLAMAEITKKYAFASLTPWLLSIIKSAPVLENDAIPVYLYPRMLELVFKGVDDSRDDMLVHRLTACLANKTLPPVEVLLVADKLGIRTLRGTAYYHQLLELLDRDDHTSMKFPPQLSRDQRVRLLSGHWSLSRRWESIRNADLPVPRGSACTPEYHKQWCDRVWTIVWQYSRKLVTPRGLVDVLGTIDAIKSSLMTGNSMDRLTPCCRDAALDVVDGLSRDIKASLADHFVDCTVLDE